ncbi:MAG: insulinase family protein [Planctomycetes bacterium]|nr:insulinase family protein [Planctomycetota bacterium]
MRVPRQTLLLPILASLGAFSSAAREPVEFTLPNGLRVRLVPVAGEAEAILLLAVRAGSLEEPAGSPHLAHVVEHMAVFNAPPGSEESAAIARWYGSGRANGETLADFMYFDLRVETAEVLLAVRVQAARLAGRNFDPEVLKREIPRALGELENLESQRKGITSKFALMALAQIAFHGKSEVPFRARTGAYTVEDVRAFHERTFRPDRAMLVVAGGFDPAVVRPVVEEAFGKVPKPEAPPAKRGAPRSGRGTWDGATSHLLFAWPAPAPGDPEFAAFLVAYRILSARIAFDHDVQAVVRAALVHGDVEGLLLVQLTEVVENDEARGTLLSFVPERVAGLARDGGVTKEGFRSARDGILALMKERRLPPLPPNVPRSTALGNMELQRMRFALPLGDLGALAASLEALDLEGFQTVVAGRFAKAKPAVVQLDPGR